MFPTLHDLFGFGPSIDTHSAFVGFALLCAILLFVYDVRQRNKLEPIDVEKTSYVVMGTLVGGAVFMRLGTWMQHLNPERNLSLVAQVVHGNASILSGLTGAWLGAHLAKRICRYKVRTGDLFAPAVALAMAIGRFGCFFTEKPGSPTGTRWGIELSPAAAHRVGSVPGVPLHPSFIYEIIFHACAFLILWFWLRKRDMASGALFTLYIGAYALFRFFIEFVRGNSVAWHGLTHPQLFLLLTIPLLALRLAVEAKAGRFRANAGYRERMSAHA